MENLPKDVYKLTPITVSKTESWFKLEPTNSYIVIKVEKNHRKLYTISNGKVKPPVVIDSLDCNNHSVEVEIDGSKYDICTSIVEIVNEYDEYVEQWTLIERAKAGDIIGTIPKMPTEWEAVLNSLVNLVLTGRIVKTFYVREGGREIVIGTYCYDNGYYVNCEETLKKQMYDIVESSPLLKLRVNPPLVGQALKKIESITLTPFTPLKKAVLFKNKIFIWDKFLETKNIEDALVDPNPDLIVMHKVPWELDVGIYKNVREGLTKYIPPSNTREIAELFKELAPKSFKAFLDWVKAPEEPEEKALDKVVLLLEIIGYTFYVHEYPLNKAVLIVGSGSNGKSVYLKLIRTILGGENTSAISLSQLDPSVNRFAAASLFNKMANLSSEPMKSKTFDPNKFKEATGEDDMFVENKFREGFKMRNYAKMIFTANELPEITEDTYAFWRRWIVIEFPNTFSPDPSFFEKTFTPEEIKAIILLSLHAFRLVLERRGFTETGINVKEEWISRSNPAYKIIKKMLEDEIIVLDPKGAVAKKDLYELYKRYAEKMREEDENILVLEQRTFTIQLTKLFPVRSGKTRIAGEPVNAYIGVKIKDYDKALELVGHLETPRPMEEWFA